MGENKKAQAGGVEALLLANIKRSKIMTGEKSAKKAAPNGAAE